MKEKETRNPNIKITTTDKSAVTEQIKAKYEKKDIHADSAIVHRAAYEPQTECNPDNGAFFEERSNPLSSKGN